MLDCDAILNTEVCFSVLGADKNLEMQMLEFLNGSSTAILVLHEIYGINQHILGVCKARQSKGYDVFCPNLLGLKKPFSYSQQEQAYANFMEQVGFQVHERVNTMLTLLRPRYKTIILEGYSVGATVAWCCAEVGFCDGVVGYYGSRIRNFLHLQPKCPALLFFALQEQGFPAEQAQKSFCHAPQVTVEILNGSHGFCDPFSAEFHAESAKTAGQISQVFIENLVCAKK